MAALLQVSEKEQDHQAREQRSDGALAQHGPDGLAHVDGLIKNEIHLDVFGHDLRELGEIRFDLVDHRQGRGVGTLGDGYIDRRLAVDEGVAARKIGSVRHRRHVAQIDGRQRRQADRHVPELLDVVDDRVQRDQGIFVAHENVPGGGHAVRLGDGLSHLVGRDVVEAELVGLEVDEDGAQRSAERRRRGDPGERREHRPHAVQGRVLKLAQGAGRAREREIADRDVSGVEAQDEGRHGPRRHERFGAIDVIDRFRQGRRHVRTGMEVQFDQSDALDVLRFDRLDPVDVEEVVLVVVDDVAFHLRRAQAAVRLRDVDRRHAQIGQDVALHARHAQRGHEDDGGDGDDHRDRAPERPADEAAGTFPGRTVRGVFNRHRGVVGLPC